MKIMYGIIEKEIDLPKQKIKQIYKFLDEWKEFKIRKNIVHMATIKFKVSYEAVMLIEFLRKRDTEGRKNATHT